MNEQIELIKLVAGRLEKAGIPYMLTGSSALDFYATPRMTRDIDLVVELNPSDTQKLHQSFSSDFYLDETAAKTAVQQRGMFNAIHQGWMIKVDFDRRQAMKLQDGSTVFVASPEDLILSKLDWSKETNSEVQKKDVQSLLSLTPGLDYNYLKKWALALGVSKQLEELKP